MKYLVILVLLVGCNSTPRDLAKENTRLQKEVDSLRNELDKCEMMLKAYENDPLTL